MVLSQVWLTDGMHDPVGLMEKLQELANVPLPEDPLKQPLHKCSVHQRVSVNRHTVTHLTVKCSYHLPFSLIFSMMSHFCYPSNSPIFFDKKFTSPRSNEVVGKYLSQNLDWSHAFST